MASSQTYVYSPLPNESCIRLLRRTGVGTDGILEFIFRVVDLNAKVTQISELPQYHSLSYTWGNPHANGVGFEESYEAFAPNYIRSERKPLRCDGKILMVERNLYDALSEIPTDGWVRRIINRPRPDTRRTLLFDRVASGNSQMVHLYVGQGANVHARDHLGRTPLHEAAIHGQLDCAMILIKGGSDFTARDKDGKTPEAHALEQSHIDVAQMLKACSEDGIEQICNEIRPFYPYGPDDFIWIDAICIDQENLAERSAQVKVMGQIYENARYVLIWLGQADKYTIPALSTISKLVSRAEKFVESPLIPYRSQSPEEYESAGIPYISAEEWDSLAALFLRRWFRRIWAVQEVAFATAIQMFCGTQEIAWSDLKTVIELLHEKYRQLGDQSSRIYIAPNDIASSVEYPASIMNMKREARFLITDGVSDDNNLEQFALDELIFTTFPFHCSDLRDKIYSLLPLSGLHAKGSLGIVPDYTQSVERCYANATKCILKGYQDLRFLSVVHDQSTKEIKALPSWVPDYSLGGTNLFPWRKFCASEGLSSRSIPDHEVWNELLLKGWKYDVIDAAADERPRGGNGKAKLEFDESWFDLILKMHASEEYAHAGQKITEVLWRTLCADQGADGEHPAPVAFAAMFRQLVCAMVCSEPETKAREEEERMERAISLGGLMKTALVLQTQEASGSRGPDEEYMASLRSKMDPVERTVGSSYFESMRSVLAKLEQLADPDCIPTRAEIEDYFKNSVNPIRQPNNLLQISPEIMPYASAHMPVYGVRRLFATKKGYLGLGPSSLQLGDGVWILPNGRLPFILRPLAQEPTLDPSPPGGSKEHRFQFIGEAYVHGIMHGEAVKNGLGDSPAEGVILM